MEGRIVCKIDDDYIKAVLIALGVGEGEGDVILVDALNDPGKGEPTKKVFIPLYDAHTFIKKRVKMYDTEVHED